MTNLIQNGYRRNNQNFRQNNRNQPRFNNNQNWSYQNNNGNQQRNNNRELNLPNYNRQNQQNHFPNPMNRNNSRPQYPQPQNIRNSNQQGPNSNQNLNSNPNIRNRVPPPVVPGLKDTQTQMDPTQLGDNRNNITIREICSHFQAGNCRYGDHCRRIHPGYSTHPNLNSRNSVPLSTQTPNLPRESLQIEDVGQGIKICPRPVEYICTNPSRNCLAISYNDNMITIMVLGESGETRNRATFPIRGYITSYYMNDFYLVLGCYDYYNNKPNLYIIDIRRDTENLKQTEWIVGVAMTRDPSSESSTSFLLYITDEQGNLATFRVDSSFTISPFQTQNLNDSITSMDVSEDENLVVMASQSKLYTIQLTENCIESHTPQIDISTFFIGKNTEQNTPIILLITGENQVHRYNPESHILSHMNSNIMNFHKGTVFTYNNQSYFAALSTSNNGSSITLYHCDTMYTLYTFETNDFLTCIAPAPNGFYVGTDDGTIKYLLLKQSGF